MNDHVVDFGPIDVDAVRQVTPACLKRVFLLSAGSSLPSTTTLDAVVAHLQLEAEIGGYAAAERAADTLTQGRIDLAALIGGRSDEVALVPSDSVGWVKAWWGWVAGGNIPAGSTVVVDRLCYHSHYAAIDQTSRLADFTVRIAPALPDGTVDLDAFEVGDDVSAVCITMIGTHSGNVNPVAAIGRRTAAAGVPMFLDACQAVGQMQLDVTELGCQVLTGTGRKFLRGPRGSGLLWVSQSIVDRFTPPGIDATSTKWTTSNGMRTDAGIGRFEEYELSYASMVGLANAAGQARDLGPAAIEQRIVALAEALRTNLASVDGVVVRDTAAQRCGIVTFTVDGILPAHVVATAADAGITINESTATWAALDMEAKLTPSVVRASPHYFNTLEEVDLLADVIDHLATSPS